MDAVVTPDEPALLPGTAGTRPVAVSESPRFGNRGPARGDGLEIASHPA